MDRKNFSLDSQADTPLQDPFTGIVRGAHDFSGRTLGGRYALRKLLGRGAFATVYLAHDQSVGGRNVAVKVLHPEHTQNANYVERFRQEVKVAARVTATYSEHLVPIIDQGTDTAAAPRLVYFVMEYVRGRSLRQLLQPYGPTSELEPLPWPRAVALTQQVCAAVAVLHEHGVIHRDIKPDNCVLEERPDGERIKLLDFGIAKLLVDATDPGRGPLTDARVVLGTPRYMAPELYLPGVAIDHEIDIYAIGVMLYEFLTGTVPRPAVLRPGEPLRRGEQETERPGAVRPDREIPAALDAVVMRAIAWLPQDRFESAEAFSAALAEASRRTPQAHAPAPAPSSPQAIGPWTRRMVAAAAWMPGAIVVMCSIAVVAVLMTTLVVSSRVHANVPVNPDVTELAGAAEGAPERRPEPPPPPVVVAPPVVSTPPESVSPPVSTPPPSAAPARRPKRPRPDPAELPDELMPVRPSVARLVRQAEEQARARCAVQKGRQVPFEVTFTPQGALRDVALPGWGDGQVDGRRCVIGVLKSIDFAGASDRGATIRARLTL